MTKQDELDLWHSWKKDKDPEKLNQLLFSLKPIIETHVNKFSGTLPKSALRAEATKLTVDALDKYDPSKSQINTHLYNRLQKLNRYVYTYQNMGKIPEPRIIQIGNMNKAISYLEDTLGREPKSEEIADYMKIPVKEVKLLAKELRKDLGTDPQYVAMNPIGSTDLDIIYMLQAELRGIDLQVLNYLFGLDGNPKLTLKEIADKLAISVSRVVQIKTKLANRLRNSGVLNAY